MITEVRQLVMLGVLVVSGLLCGCGSSSTPDVERPMEEVEAELAPAEG